METTYKFSKFYGRSPTKYYKKKRVRSQSNESLNDIKGTTIKRRSVRFKKSSIKPDVKISVDEMSEACCEKMKKLKISEGETQRMFI